MGGYRASIPLRTTYPLFKFVMRTQAHLLQCPKKSLDSQYLRCKSKPSYMVRKQPKTHFEFLFPIINTKDNDLFANEYSYGVLKRRYRKSTHLLEMIDIDQLYIADFYANQYPVLNSLYSIDLEADITWLINYANLGKKITANPTALERLFMPKELKKRLYLLKMIGERDTLAILEVVKNHIGIIQCVKAIARTWHIDSMVFESYVELHSFLLELNGCAKETLSAYEKGIQAVQQLF